MVDIVIKTTLGIFIFALIINLGWLIRSMLAVRGAQRRFFIAWALYFLAVAMFFQKTQAGSATDPQSLYQLICIGLGVVMLMSSFIGAHLQARKARAAVVLLFLYGTLGVLTAVMSPIPLLSAYKASLVVFDSLLLLGGVSLIRTRVDAWRLFAFTSFMVSLFAVGSLAGALIWPSSAFRPIIGGAFGFILDGTFPMMNGNELGFIGGMTMVVAFRRFFEASGFSIRFYWLAQGLVGLIVLGLAQARTSLLTATVAVIAISYVLPRFRIIAIIGTLMIVPIGGYVLLAGGISGNNANLEMAQTYLEKGQDDGGLQSIEGRMSGWAGPGLQMIMQSPIVGHGFDAGTRISFSEQSLYGHFHNSHVQILVNSGVLGYALWLSLILFVMSKGSSGFIKECLPTAQTSDAREYAEVVAITWMIVLRTFTGSVLVTHQWSIMILIASIIFFCSNKSSAEVVEEKQKTYNPQHWEWRATAESK